LAAVAAAAVWVSAAPSARAQDGEALFRRQCAACHTVEAGRNKIGPSLARSTARRRRGAGFRVLRRDEGLEGHLERRQLAEIPYRPQGLHPRTKMVYAGMKNPDDAKAVADYLKGLK